jgi:sugar phosphate isomerase/epimerase
MSNSARLRDASVAAKPWRNRLSISTVSLWNSPMEEQLDIISASGCGGIAVFQFSVPPGWGAGQVREAMDRHQLVPTFCVSYPHSLMDSWTFDRGAGRMVTFKGATANSVQDIKDALRWFAPVTPAAMIIMPGAQGARCASEAWDFARSGFIEIADFAGDLGITVALEPVHPRFATDYSIISTIDQALQMIDEIGRSNVGVLIETFQVAGVSDLFGQIARAAGRIVGVQLSDGRPFPRSLADRLPPGEGSIDIPAIIRAIEATGYTGWYDVEIASIGFPDSVYNRSPEDIAFACVMGSVQAFKAAMV